jgi:adenosylcobinamide amidohydrolase
LLFDTRLHLAAPPHPTDSASSMLLEDTERLTLRRRDRFLWAALKRPHRVLSTCKVNGGLREDLTHLANHQSCEGVGHATRYARNLAARPRLDDFHQSACAKAGLPAATTALMATAANMQCALIAQAQRDEIGVTVAATAGVLGNALRAGDPADWHEHQEGSRPAHRQSPTALAAHAPLEREPAALPAANTADRLGDSRSLDKAPLSKRKGDPGIDGECRNGVRDNAPAPDETGSGTIVMLVFINQPCTAACLTRAATMVTEARSTALLDLRMASLQSHGLATGTGTDQLIIAAPLPREGDWERNWAGGHNTLGELLARATHEAVTRCLLLQNGVCAELRRSICGALGRYGCDEAALINTAHAMLAPADAELFENNLTAIVHDPQSAAAAYGLAEIIDLTHTGVLHAEVARESIVNQAALLAAAVAVAPEHFAALRDALRRQHDAAPAELAARAVALGFAQKWN